MFDVVYVWEPDVQYLKEFGFDGWKGRIREEFEKVTKVVAAVIIPGDVRSISIETNIPDSAVLMTLENTPLILTYES